MKSKDDLLAFLDVIGVAHTTTEHRAVFRVGEGEDVRAALPGAHSKNLFLKDAKGQLWLISASDSAVIDLKGLPTVIGAARLSFGSAERLQQTLGVTPGSVTAFALINDAERRIRFVLDKTLAEASRVNFHPLTNTATTTVSQRDFRRFLAALDISPLIVDFERLTLIPSQDAR